MISIKIGTRVDRYLDNSGGRWDCFEKVRTGLSSISSGISSCDAGIFSGTGGARIYSFDVGIS